MQFRLRRPTSRRWIASGEAPVPSNVKDFSVGKPTEKILNMVAANIAPQY